MNYAFAYFEIADSFVERESFSGGVQWFQVKNPAGYFVAHFELLIWRLFVCTWNWFDVQRAQVYLKITITLFSHKRKVETVTNFDRVHVFNCEMQFSTRVNYQIFDEKILVILVRARQSVLSYKQKVNKI